MFSGSRSNAKSKKQLKIKLVTFHPQALDEIIETAQYYETCCVGLGEKFIDQVERAAYVIQKILTCLPLINWDDANTW